MLIDHEMGFSFTQVLPFGRNPRPWEIPDIEIEWIHNHFCFPILKGNILDLDTFTKKLALVSDQFWSKASKLIPVEWVNDNLKVLQDYLGSIVTNREKFAAEINRILA
jgi:hypothetical protein